MSSVGQLCIWASFGLFTKDVTTTVGPTPSTSGSRSGLLEAVPLLSRSKGYRGFPNVLCISSRQSSGASRTEPME